MAETKYKLTEEQIKAIEHILNRGNRAEIIPLKDNVKIFWMKRVLVEPDKPEA